MRGWLPPGPRTLVGIGDDAAVLAAPDGRVVATTDFVLEGRHFRRDWSDPVDIGHKAAARSLADVAAMGARPAGLLVALAAPPDLPVPWLRSLADGLAAESARAGAAVIGGDTARADTVILAVTGLGDLAGRPPVLRSGAHPGDVVAVAGPLGHAAAGLALLAAGRRAPGVFVAAQLRPSPPYEAGPAAAALGATAMIDVSDGLLADLGHLAAASKVRIDVRSAALADPLLADLITAGGITPGTAAVQPPELAWILTGGEDHSLAACFPPDVQLPPPWRPIGTVLPPSARPSSPTTPSPATPSASAVVVDGRPFAGPAGWDHFRLAGAPWTVLDTLVHTRAGARSGEFHDRGHFSADTAWNWPRSWSLSGKARRFAHHWVKSPAKPIRGQESARTETASTVARLVADMSRLA